MATNVNHRPATAPIRLTSRGKALSIATVIAVAVSVGIAWPSPTNTSIAACTASATSSADFASAVEACRTQTP